MTNNPRPVYRDSHKVDQPDSATTLSRFHGAHVNQELGNAQVGVRPVCRIPLTAAPQGGTCRPERPFLRPSSGGLLGVILLQGAGLFWGPARGNVGKIPYYSLQRQSVPDGAADQRPSEAIPEIAARCRRNPQPRSAWLRKSQHRRIEAAHAQGLQKAAGWRRVSHLTAGICHDFAGSAMPPADEAESHQSHNGPPDAS